MHSLNLKRLVNSRAFLLAMVSLLSFSIPSAVIEPVQADPPEQEQVEITTFTASWVYNNVWEFSGSIGGGPTLDGRTVNFGGIINGESCVTNSIGEFYLSVAIPESGTATAIAYSVDEIPSAEERTEAGN